MRLGTSRGIRLTTEEPGLRKHQPITKQRGPKYIILMPNPIIEEFRFTRPTFSSNYTYSIPPKTNRK